ncbi:carboxylesterase type B [Penicillium angulare]|uniref:carboxylesterase type B n=1 Tax=Penicillium angulare TaxID=116970 RepID=UPI0025424A70|nr:carboxylesterase type B [Penicillium angulare]KAJ5281301.1 carboxylesterase type B [Penicillium angulare]
MKFSRPANLISLATAAAASSGLQVETSSGTVNGIINSTFPHVRQFLAIPFAQPPVGDLRWLPPQELPENSSSTSIDATALPASCPQTISTGEGNPFAKYAPETVISGGVSEDCLFVSVWAPNNDKTDLPVIIWIYGGEFAVGGTNIPAWIPSPWVERTQEHIVVSLNYRLNIFGFPASPALENQNLGILDQRAAIEWVQKNIAKFGGDPDQIILWGQSAGAGSVDIQNFAYPENPIVQGFACDSGSAFLTVDTRSTDNAGTNFSTVAGHFGCSGSSQNELDCLRKVSSTKITSFLGTSNGSSLTFSPFIDNKVVFENYTERYLGNHLSDKPALFGSNLNEGTLLAGGQNSATAEAITLSTFQCPVPYSTAYRESLGLTTYRYQYRGNFSNISPESGLGAYHTAELPLIFGTSRIYGKDTSFEKAVSHKMQDLWLAFAKDPSGGLAEAGWPKSSSDEFLLLANSTNNIVSAVSADIVIDNSCTSYYSSYLV